MTTAILPPIGLRTYRVSLTHPTSGTARLWTEATGADIAHALVASGLASPLAGGPVDSGRLILDVSVSHEATDSGHVLTWATPRDHGRFTGRARLSLQVVDRRATREAESYLR